MAKTYAIPCVWQMWGIAHVTAPSFKEAVDKAYNDVPLPDGEYIADSFEVDLDSLTLEEDKNMDADDLEYLRIARDSRNEEPIP